MTNPKHIYEVTLVFQEPILAPYQPMPAVDSRYRKTHPDLKGVVVFARGDNDRPEIRDYLLKGAIKEWARSVARMSSAYSQIRSKVVRGLFVSPRRIELMPPEGWEHPCDGALPLAVRSFRAQYVDGCRTTFHGVESMPAGSRATFQLHLFDSLVTREVIGDLFDFGSRSVFSPLPGPFQFTIRAPADSVLGQSDSADMKSVAVA